MNGKTTSLKEGKTERKGRKAEKQRGKWETAGERSKGGRNRVSQTDEGQRDAYKRLEK